MTGRVNAARRRVTADELATPLLPFEEARTRILESFAPLPAVQVAVADAAGLVIAERVISPIDVPGFDNSAMDGYAVRSADVADATSEAPAMLRLVADLPAGTVTESPLPPGAAATIMTGAPMPSGADAVVPWEDSGVLDGGVAVRAPVRSGKHVRPYGEDLRAGAVIVEAGTLLRPVHAGVLASIGRTSVACHPRPRVGVLSTGDELAPPGGSLPPGHVYDANSVLLAALCRGSGATVVAAGLVGDDPDEMSRWLASAAASADVIVTSGGASVGEHDWMRAVLSREGELTLWRVALKPGKPVAFGRFNGVPVLVLPGNPGSAFACTHAFVLPAIRRLAGKDPWPQSRTVVLAEAVPGSPTRTLLCRVILDGEKAIPLPAQSSVVLSNLMPAQGFAIVPPGGLGSGSEVVVELIE